MHAPRLVPDRDATALAEQMRQRHDVMREILSETINSAGGGQITESGRTVCGSAADPLPPGTRFPKAVQLQACPRAATGTYHTHATQDELQNPEHSLPDWANVIFNGVDASLVVGTQSAEQIVAAEDREVMANAFQDALGFEVQSTDAVVGALQRREIEDPPSARQRVRRRLAPLVSRHTTGYTDLSTQTQSPAIPAYTPGFDALVAHQSARPQAPSVEGPDAGGLREASHAAAEVGARAEDAFNLKETAIGNAVGVVVGGVVSKALGL